MKLKSKAGFKGKKGTPKKTEIKWQRGIQENKQKNLTMEKAMPEFFA